MIISVVPPLTLYVIYMCSQFPFSPVVISCLLDSVKRKNSYLFTCSHRIPLLSLSSLCRYVGFFKLAVVPLLSPSIWIAGAVGILWFFFWIFLAYSSPATHPRISRKEREYIESSIAESTEKQVYIICIIYCIT